MLSVHQIIDPLLSVIKQINISIAAALLSGCAELQYQAPSPHLAATVSRPSFEPMCLEDYSAKYPDLLGLSCGMEKFFDTYINVFGVTIAAMPNTPVPEIIHAAKVYAQLIDNDEDFIPDDPKIYEYHQKDSEGRNSLIVLVDSKAFDNQWIAYKPGQRFWVPAQALRPGHSGVGHSKDGEMDIAVEELFHKYGKALQRVYIKDFGLPDEESGDTWSSTLSDAMDRARGIDRTIKPVGGRWVYPDDAWYTYDDTSCGWGCQIDEYLWHVWATNIGYYEMLTRPPDTPKREAKPHGWCKNIHLEWKLCNRHELREMDFAAYQLINNNEYKIPTKIPFGEYGGSSVEYHGYEIDVLSAEGNRFTVNRKLNPKLILKRGNTYYFDQSLKGNVYYPLRFSASKDGTHSGGEEYREGVAVNGLPGKRGSYVKITVADNAPDRLYLYCSRQIGMAGNGVVAVKD